MTPEMLNSLLPYFAAGAAIAFVIVAALVVGASMLSSVQNKDQDDEGQ